MKKLITPPEEGDERQKFGKQKYDGTARTAPSQKGHTGVETESTSVKEDSKIPEDVTLEQGGIFDELPPSIPSSARETPGGSAEQEDIIARLVKKAKEGWEQRFEKKIYFEEFQGFFGGDYHLLFFQGCIFVSARDAAWAATCADYLGSTYSATDIVEKLNVRNWIEVPGPEIPADSDCAVRGLYIPLETMCSWLIDSKFGCDANEFFGLIGEFEDRMAWLRVARTYSES